MDPTNWRLLRAFLILIVLALVLSSLGGWPFMMRPWMMRPGVGAPYNSGIPYTGVVWWGLLGGLGRLAFLGALIVGAVLLFRRLERSGAGSTLPPSRESSVDILKRRYAAGEISREQFQQMRQDLER
jgi:putative membrane protein